MPFAYSGQVLYLMLCHFVHGTAHDKSISSCFRREQEAEDGRDGEEGEEETASHAEGQLRDVSQGKGAVERTQKVGRVRGSLMFSKTLNVLKTSLKFR